MSFWSLSTIFAICMLSFSADSLPLVESNTNSTTPHINFAIHDHNGLDVTSSFKIMLYQEPQAKGTTNLNDRQVDSFRLINECADREGVFVESSCSHKNVIEGSLRAYTYRCMSYAQETGGEAYSQRIILPYYGECDEDEMCVKGRGMSELWRRPIDIAVCMRTEAYTEVTSSNDTGALHKAFTDVRMDATLSTKDQKTLFKADSINLEAGVSALGGAKGSTQRKSCVDCVELTSDLFAPKTDSLDTEVKLLTAGTAAAGILWLTFLAG